jgi:4-amino-4-deoxy-L-arabinose transferase-like glycosyltransferase
MIRGIYNLMKFGPEKINPSLSSDYWPIILILIIAAALRLNNITQPFIDDNAWRESSVAMMARNFHQKSWNIFYPEVNWVGPGPGYQGREFQTITYIAALFYLLLGQHDWIGRCLVVTFGLLGIFALYQLIRLLWGKQLAITAAALMAVFPGVIRLERSFLPDPAMVALVVTSFWMLVLYLQTDRRRYLTMAAVIGTLGALTKIPGMIVGLPMVYAAISILKHRRILLAEKVIRLVTVGILTALPVAAYYLWARHIALSYPPHHFAGEGNWIWDQGLEQWAEQRFFIPLLWGKLTALWTLPGIALLSLGIFLPLFKKVSKRAGSKQAIAESSNDAPWLFHWWIAAGAVYYFIGARELVENPSNLHILSPAVAALSAYGIVALASLVFKQSKRRALRIAVVALLVVSIGVWGQRRSRLHSSYAKQSYELGLALKSVSQPDDPVVILGDIIGCPVAIYYSERRGWLFPPFEEIKDWNMLPEDDETIEIFERLRAKGAEWFGVVNNRKGDIWEARPKFARHIERTCELKETNKDAVIYRVLSQEELAKPRN